MSTFDLRIRDHALDPRQFTALLRAVRRVGTERLRQTYQTAFWFDLRTPPTSMVEAAAVALASLALRPRDRSHVRGVEWWLSRMRTTDVRVDFHQDHDIQKALRSGRIIHPRISSVLFLNRAKGGLLAVTDEPPNPRNPACAPDRLDQMDLVRPVPNRFAVFPGALTHGVLDRDNRVPQGGRTGSTGPLRLAIILNWWSSQPQGVRRFSDSRVYPALRLRGM